MALARTIFRYVFSNLVIFLPQNTIHNAKMTPFEKMCIDVG